MPRVITWGDIELQAILGEGQSGIVWRALLRRDVAGLTAGTAVAVKRYKPWVLHERGQIDRIFAEVETGRKIDHPNVMRVLGAVLDDSGHPALVMKFYSGDSLAGVLAQAREQRMPLSLETSFSYLADVANAIACLHRHGIVHRDLKPANVLVTETGLVVADFGVVRSRDLPEQTTTGAFLGTIRYAAPEYLFGGNYDHRIDVYSFGAIAYELFTNKEVFDGEKHWARVVAARAGGETPIQHDELRPLAARIGFHAASLVERILHQSRCSVHARNLDLPSFVAAARDEIWTKRFIFEHGALRPGVQIFSERFRTAEEATSELRAVLTAGEIAELAELLEEHYWGRIPAFAISAKLWSGLKRLKLVKGSAETKAIRVSAAIKEAFALGLLAKSA
jgi:eukaryotic-like serine/threonine-protein kinase